jgi:hypothetical protein
MKEQTDQGFAATASNPSVSSITSGVAIVPKNSVKTNLSGKYLLSIHFSNDGIQHGSCPT